MRFKLILTVKSEVFGNVLPASYQYELSSCIHRKIMEQEELCATWLARNGFSALSDYHTRLFSISNFYIPKIKVDRDRLCILARRVQLWISFLPTRGTEELVRTIFQNAVLMIGDKISRVEFVVDEIVPCLPPDDGETQEYLALSPIVFVKRNGGGGFEYVGPDCPEYGDLFLNSVLNRYEAIYGVPYEGDPKFKFELLSEPKRKGIVVMRFTPSENKVIGFMYKFRLTLDPVLQHLIYETGLGDRTHFGFGCIELLR
jgi:CRISPR-associated endoribonuclease cas6